MPLMRLRDRPLEHVGQRGAPHPMGSRQNRYQMQCSSSRTHAALAPPRYGRVVYPGVPQRCLLRWQRSGEGPHVSDRVTPTPFFPVSRRRRAREVSTTTVTAAVARAASRDPVAAEATANNDTAPRMSSTARSAAVSSSTAVGDTAVGDTAAQDAVSGALAELADVGVARCAVPGAGGWGR